MAFQSLLKNMDANEAPFHPDYRFKDGRVRNTARIPKARWDKYKQLLCSLYQEMTINDILIFMRTEHGFVANASQLGRKLREWGVYKYDSKNRPSDTISCFYPGPSNGAFKEPFPQAVSEDVSIPEDLPVYPLLAPDMSQSRTEPTEDTDPAHYMSFGGTSQILPNPDEAHSTLNEPAEIPKPAEYEDANITYQTWANPPPAAIAASGNLAASMSTTQHFKEHKEDAASSVPAGTAMTKEPEHGHLSDIDMDRFSSISFTPSVSSGFASLRSLAQRIAQRQRREDCLDRDWSDDLPSSVMQWNRSSGSFRLFSRLSFASSISSSASSYWSIGGSRISLRPEIPQTIQEHGGAPGGGLRARFTRPKVIGQPSIGIITDGWSADDLDNLAKITNTISQRYRNASSDRRRFVEIFDEITRKLQGLASLLRKTGWPKYAWAPTLQHDLEKARGCFSRFLIFTSFPDENIRREIGESLRAHVERMRAFTEYLISSYSLENPELAKSMRVYTTSLENPELAESMRVYTASPFEQPEIVHTSVPAVPLLRERVTHVRSTIHSSDDVGLVTGDQYTCTVINLPLVEQTRRTRIAKRLELSMDKTEFWMPALPWRCIDYLSVIGCEEESLYAIPGSSGEVKYWQKKFDIEHDINLFDEPEVCSLNAIGSLLQTWLRELPGEIFPRVTQQKIAESCPGASETPQSLKDEVSELPPFNYYLLFAITGYLSLLLCYADKNKMDYHNLCIYFQSTLKIDGICFQFLIQDWKNCWQGCWTEKKYLEAEYRYEREGSTIAEEM